MLKQPVLGQVDQGSVHMHSGVEQGTHNLASGIQLHSDGDNDLNNELSLTRQGSVCRDNVLSLSPLGSGRVD